MKHATLHVDGFEPATIAVADGLWSRFRGLMLRGGMPEGVDALLFPSCSSLHTCFMRFALDIAFVREGRVVRLAEDVRPWRLAAGPRRSDALEMPAGTARRLGLVEGASVVVVRAGAAPAATPRGARG